MTTSGRDGYIPTSLEEALAIRSRHARGELGSPPVRPVAGGTDLMVRFRPHAPVPVRLDARPLFIASLAELRGIAADAQGWRIGAAVRLSDLGEHELCDDGLRETLRWFASPAIRNAATIGGNVCNASPAADLLPWLFVRDATLVLASADERREIAVREFVTGPGRTTLRDDELLVEVLVPDRGSEPSAGPSAGPTAGSPASRAPFTFYRKVAPRRANALSKLSVYAEADRSADRSLSRCAIAIGAVAPTVVRAPGVESMLVGATADDLRPTGGRGTTAVEAGARPAARSPLVARILAEYEPLILPIDDQRSTADYRGRTALRLLADLLEHVLPDYLEVQP